MPENRRSESSHNGSIGLGRRLYGSHTRVVELQANLATRSATTSAASP